MATYFHHNTADIQQAHDGLHTLVLMNPAYVQYSTDAPPPQPPQTNLLFLNSASTTSISPSTLLHAPPPHPQQFVGIPLPSTASASPDPNSPSIHTPHHDLSSMHGLMPRVHYNVWNTLDPSVAAREASRSQGGLSLSLSSQQPGFGSFRNEREAPHAPHAPPRDTGVTREDVLVSGESPSSASGVTNAVPGVQSVLLSSKYLKAAQELLDEVVNVGSGIKTAQAMLKKPNSNGPGKAAADGESSASAAAKEDESGGRKSGGDLTTAERQEIQMKKAKLINMLDEVEQRYRQYHYQMQIVISSFEQVAGVGSARTYTALALQTISKQFRCLKDAITGQIRSANKSLGEEDGPGGKLEGSRLKFVDHHIRQQRALQQLGMIQHNAWRPQRGLPERSVSILRAWLFEHFLHPYPKDSDKHTLAKQTGLTRNQVSNWFINARVRLWKPMVEEMYTEEVKEQGQNGGEDKTSKSEQNEDPASKSSGPQDNAPSKNHVKNFKENGSTKQEAPVPSPRSTSSVGGNVRNQSGFALIGTTELEGIKQGSPKRPRNIEMLHSPNSFTSMNVETTQARTNNEQVSLKFADDRHSRDGYGIVGGGPTNFIGGLGQYPIPEIGRFGAEQFAPTFPGNSVSLTLGLPHSDNLSLSGAPQNFLPSPNIQLGRRVDISDANEFSAINTSIAHSSTAYDGIDIQNRKRFVAQLLPDFVA